MIGVIIRSPVSHGWLIILSQPSYKNSFRPRCLDEIGASNDCEDVLRFTSLLYIVQRVGRIKKRKQKTSAHESRENISAAQILSRLRCDSVSRTTRQHVPAPATTAATNTKWSNIFERPCCFDATLLSGITKKTKQFWQCSKEKSSLYLLQASTLLSSR